VDTGGVGLFDRQTPTAPFDGLIRDQVYRALDTASRVIWVVDAQAGITPLDSAIGERLRRCQCPVLVAANKADNASLDAAAAAEFAALGFPLVIPVSCLHRRGLDELVAQVTVGLTSAAAPGVSTGLCLAVVGRPNVGKSSLVNRLLGEERMLVSEVPGTTRDAVDSVCQLTLDDQVLAITLVDTAGLRRRSHVDNAVEFFSVNRAESAIRRCDVVLLVLEATEPATAQDRRIADLIQAAGKPCIVVANKWDLATAARLRQKQVLAAVREGLPFMDYAPVVCVCALSGYNLRGLLQALFDLRRHLQTTVATSVLNQFLSQLVARMPPPATGSRALKILYGTMVGSPPPRFVLFVNDPRLCPPSYQSYLRHQLQEAFFAGTGLPVQLTFRGRRAPGRGRVAGHSRRDQVSGRTPATPDAGRDLSRSA
jgi:GTP-binding protein